MAYQTKLDYVSKSSKEFKATIKNKADKIGKLQDRVGIQKDRPFNHLESNAVCILFGVGEFADVARDCLWRRMKDIPNAKQRVGIMQWAARSLFEDMIQTLDVTSAERYSAYASMAKLECTTRRAGALPDYQRTVWDEDLYQVAKAAWTGTCMMCGKHGAEARECELQKTFRHLQILDPSDDKECPFRDISGYDDMGMEV